MAEESKEDEVVKLFWETPDGRAKLYHGDSRRMPEIETGSIDMIATSPPYWGKRDYGEDVVTIWGGEDGCEHEWLHEKRILQHGGQTALGEYIRPETGKPTGGAHTHEHIKEDLSGEVSSAYCSLCGAWHGQLGLEPTWQEYIQHLCECAQEWWRVLRPTGNLFVNMGDTFAGSWGEYVHKGLEKKGTGTFPRLGRNPDLRPPQSLPGLIPKNKLGIPYRLRFALNDMGWVSRGDYVWYKGKEYPDGHITKVAMPESVKDRMSCSYEMLFHFVKEPKGYWFDLDAVRRPLAQSSLQRISQVLDDQRGGPKEAGYIEGHVKPGGSHLKQISGILKNLKDSAQRGQGSNPGDVWIIQPEPFKEAHYAVWPSKLCERMIKVGCPKEVCSKCGKPRERMTQAEARPSLSSEEICEIAEKRGIVLDEKSPGVASKGRSVARLYSKREPPAEHHTIGWSDCGCGEGFVPGVVLDPFFGGSGRIAERALYLGRNIIGVDMKEEYLEMAKKRLLQGVLL